MIGLIIIMACFVDHSVRDLFLKDTITPQKGAPILLNHIMYGRRLENITQVMSYRNLSIPEFNELGFWRYLVWDIVDSTLDEDIEAGGVDGRRLR